MPDACRPDPERLAAAIIEMRRALRRSSTPAEGAPQDQGGDPTGDRPALSPLEIEVVRFVGGHPGSGTSAIARALRVRPNTASGVCSALVRAGMLRREQDPQDRRAARFHLTDGAAARRDHRMSARGHRLRTALELLDEADVGAIAEALPALERLSDALESVPAPHTGPSD